MPEGDTVWQTCARLHAALAGRQLSVVDLRWPGLSEASLVGVTTIEVVARGKHILHRLDNGWTLHSHLRMEGSWRVEKAVPSRSLHVHPTGPGRARPAEASGYGGFSGALGGLDQRARSGRLPGGRDVRAVLATSEAVAVGSKLGMLDLVRSTDEDQLVGHLGPDVLGPTWDAMLAADNLTRQPGVGIGAALLDQRNLAGLGTVYVSESLFLQRVNPWRPIGDLSREQVSAVVARAARLLQANRDNPRRTTTGSRVKGEQDYVHGRSGRPCRRCGGPVRIAALTTDATQRVMFYCPTCQGGLAPTDDGTRQAPLGSVARPA